METQSAALARPFFASMAKSTLALVVPQSVLIKAPQNRRRWPLHAAPSADAVADHLVNDLVTAASQAGLALRSLRAGSAPASSKRYRAILKLLHEAEAKTQVALWEVGKANRIDEGRLIELKQAG